MKIKTAILVEYLEKSTLAGEISNTHLNFTEDGVTSRVMDSSNVAATEYTLSKKGFTEYEPIGEIFIKDSNTLLKWLGIFGKEIELKKENNYLKIFDEKDFTNVILGEEESCDRVFKNAFPTDLPHNVEFTLEKDLLAKAIKKKDIIKSDEIIFAVEEGKLNLLIGEKEMDNAGGSKKIDSKEKATTKVGSLIDNVARTMSKNVKIKMGTDMPMFIIDNSELIKGVTLIAPRVYNPEDDVEEEDTTEEKSEDVEDETTTE